MKYAIWRLGFLVVLLVDRFSPAVQAQISLTNGLVAWYPFNGNSQDASSNHLNGNPVGITYMTNRFGNPTNAIRLNGSSYVGINYATNFNFTGSGQFTLSAWFQLSGYGSGSFGIGSLIVKGNSSGIWDYGLECPFQNKYVLWAGLNYQYPCVSTNLLVLGQWYQGVLTYSNAVWQLFLNGQLLVRTNTGYTISQSSGGLAIGRKGDAAGDYFNGAIDDVRIYNRALATNEVASLYQYEGGAGQFVGTALMLQLSTTNLVPGGRYQIQASDNLTGWTNYHLPFTALSTNTPQFVSVTNGHSFFRIVTAP